MAGPARYDPLTSPVGHSAELPTAHRWPPPPQAEAPSRRRGRTGLVVVLAVLVVLVTAAGGLIAVSETLGDNVARIPDPFTGLDQAERPAATAALTFLLVGTDSRSTDPTTGSGAAAPAFVPGAQRSDVVMLAQFSPDRRTASVVSIPRDSWVAIPGRGMSKVNAAYSVGGAALLVETVEQLTKVRVDHFAVIDFAGFRSVVDAIGGVDVAVAAPTSSAGVQFHQGVNHLDGDGALVYVRQRDDLPGGDLAREARQQNVLRAVLDRISATDLLAHPLELYAFLDAITRSISLDATLTNAALRSMVLDLRHLRPGGVVFVSTPVLGPAFEGAQSVVLLDGARDAELWAALRGGSPTDYAERHPGDLLAPSPP
ncbi:MAG TPA: LCP family protein [Pseudonocardia sp.]